MAGRAAARGVRRKRGEVQMARMEKAAASVRPSRHGRAGTEQYGQRRSVEPVRVHQAAQRGAADAGSLGEIKSTRRIRKDVMIVDGAENVNMNVFRMRQDIIITIMAHTASGRESVMIEGDIGVWTKHHTVRLRDNDGLTNITGGNLMTEREDLTGREGTAIMGVTDTVNGETAEDKGRKARAAKKREAGAKRVCGKCKKGKNGRRSGKGDQRGCICRTNTMNTMKSTRKKAGLNGESCRRQNRNRLRQKMSAYGPSKRANVPARKRPKKARRRGQVKKDGNTWQEGLARKTVRMRERMHEQFEGERRRLGRRRSLSTCAMGIIARALEDGGEKRLVALTSQ